MPIIKKPDYTIFASEAKNGELSAFPDLLRGWGVTIDQTAGKPPMEWFNTLQKRTDEWLTYLSQRGISEWDNTLDYPKNAVVQSGGNFYVSITENKSKSPDKSQSDWKSMADALNIKIQDATLTSKGIVQLSNATDSASEVMAATPKAVKSIADRVSTLNVKTVNAKSPDANGNIQITSADTGSLPSGGTAVAAAKLATPRAIGGTNFDGTGNITPALCTSASKLQTARTIAGVAFDGQSNIAIPAGNVGAYTKAEVDSRIAARGAKNTASKAARGWWKCGDTGVIFQWGTVGRGNDLPVTFPIAFPAACISVQISQNSSQYGSSSTSNISASGKNRTGFVSHIYTNEVGADWLAVGY
ncbi:phage tail protein [Yersinia pestis subsp. pestis]|uniref:gp53-like domain-containing protein n=3 Tax=Yersinia pestis TaxID=632 RepID=UPI000578AADF|nr:tail fiber protein [Yersinia pestis]MBP1376057.1 tail fiber protein [Yersinia pestis subsp. pestis]MCF2964494.1 phage tail protein [Yersinia pestis subsp. pestis]PVF14514.1 hypothetical protein A9322_20475 [Yersinia pestis]PVF22231.1 hypothetical protein A9324_20305 [Yersinia pestis]PVF23880.1 hypothetical protein A9323_18885 [Yersinia pestis]